MARKKDGPQEKFKTMIGGQALIEGIMMRGPEKQAVVVRTQEGTTAKVEPLEKKTGFYTWPLVRGVVNFAGSMISGVKSLMYSAEVSTQDLPDQEPEKQSKFDAWLEKKMGTEKFMQYLVYVAAFVGIAFSVGLFFVVPILLGSLFSTFALKNVTPEGLQLLLQHLFEGLLRVIIFLVYMFIISRMKDMRRVFSYHGAEHKTIRCYEAKLPLTVENVRPMTRFHPRCGTSFLFVIMILSILLFTILSEVLLLIFPGLSVLRTEKKLLYNLLMMVIKIVIMLPLVVSVGYEFNRLVGRHDNWLTRVLTAPGLWLQRLTTNEPDDSMIEVAIEALTLVIPEKEGADTW